MKFFVKVLLLSLNILFIFTPSQAVNLSGSYKNLQFEKIHTEFMLNSMIEDKDGFFWLGTQSGLVKYNGHDFFIYKAGPGSIPGNFVNVLYEDNEGLIWIGTTNGLAVYDKRTDTFSTFKTDTKDSTTLSNDSFQIHKSQSIYEDQLGSIWIGTEDGLNKFDKKTRTFSRYRHIPGDPKSISDNNIWAIINADKESIWIATSTGLDYFNIKKDEVEFQYNLNLKGHNSVKKYQPVSIYKDMDGYLWIGTQNEGLIKFNPATKNFSTYLHDSENINSISHDSVLMVTAFEEAPDILWVLTDGGGLNLLDINTNHITRYQYFAENPKPNGISGNKLWGILQDKMGTIWIAEGGGVLNKFDADAQQFKNLLPNPNNTNSLSQNQYIGKIIEDSTGAIWIAASGGGLDRYDRQTRKFEHFRNDPLDPESLPETICQSVFEDKDKKLWASTHKWIVLLDKNSGKVKERYQAKNLPCLPVEDKNNPDIIWWGSWGSGLIKFNKNTGQINYLTLDEPTQSFRFNSKMILPFLQDSDGLIWIAELGGGLNKFDPVTEKIVSKYTYNPDDPLSIGSNTIWHVYKDSKDRIWVATENGLNLYDQIKDGFTSFSKSNGTFPINTIAQIIEDSKGWLWVAGYTTGEIVHFNPENGTYILYNKHNGVHSGISGPFKPLKTKNGALWFYGRGGITVFDPAKIIKNNYKPPVFITSLTQNGKDIVLGRAIEKVSEINLDWQQNSFEFEITALNYRNSHANQYKYILEGFDSEWYHSGTNRKGRYARLPGGQYTLRIRGANNDGIWSDKEATLIVKVNYPFWKMTWFYFFLACLFFIGIALIYSYLKKLKVEVQNRKQAEEMLREKHLQLQAILDHAPALISIKDMEGTVILANRNFELLDIPPLEEFIGKNVFELFPKEVAKDLWQNDLMALEKDGPIEAEEVVSHKDGTLHTYLTIKFPLYSRNRKPFGICAISTDITERKKLESKLLQAQKMESIGTLAGGIAHDFNNLLYPIIGFSEMLKEDLPQDSPEHESAQEIFNAGRRGGELVKQILAFSRQTENKLSPVRFQKVLKEVCKLTRSTIPSDIKIHQDIQKDCGLVMAEATQLHQIAINLITNAYHAVEKASGEISIQLKEILLDNDDFKDSPLQSGQYVMLSVSDNGVGIPREIMNNIFEPYFTTKEKGKGTGLGLAVVYGILTEHKGDIKVYSEEGKGTTFNVYLPLMKKPTEAISTEKVLNKLTGTERILLVDDEESVVRLEKQILERLGYNVTAQSNSLEALETFNFNPDGYDLVISDMTMPNMTGDKLAKEILAVRSDMPVIICTGFSERINKEQAESIGIKGFLMKPVVKSEMAHMVRRVLDEAKIS